MNLEGVLTRRGTGRWQQGTIGNLMRQAEESRMSASTCIAYREDGTLCRAPASFFDWQRGGLVCRDHSPRHNIIYSGAERTRPCLGNISVTSPQSHIGHRSGPSKQENPHV
jgi:hypothetical protein